MIRARLFNLVIAAWLALMSLATVAHASEHDLGGVHSGSYCHLYQHAEQLSQGLAGQPPSLVPQVSVRSRVVDVCPAPLVASHARQRIRAPPISSN